MACCAIHVLCVLCYAVLPFHGGKSYISILMQKADSFSTASRIKRYSTIALVARVVYTVGNLHTSASAEIVSSILVKQDLDSFFRNGERENEIQPLVNKL